MIDVWVCNASPLIALAKVGHADLLLNLSRQLIIPEAVANELSAGPTEDAARKLIESDWGTRANPLQIPPRLMEWALGRGEEAVLAIALEKSPALAVLDDAAARRCAKTIGVQTIGTLGIILLAKKQKLLPSVGKAMQALRDAGFYLDDETIRLALASVGETWSAK